MIESVGVVTSMALIGAKQIHSINSFVLDYENRKNPSPERRSFIEKLLAEVSEFIRPNDSITKRALELEKKGVMGMDALHVASAEQARADYFVSCDDVLVKRLGAVEDLKVRALGQLEFISREVL
jgi:predicted nucleic acid-binding protein